MLPVQPIARGAQGAAVANLQDALLFWLATLAPPLAADAAALARALAPERKDPVYKDATVKAVAFFQQQTASRFNLKASGDCNDPTAAALNQILAELGAPKDPPSKPNPTPPIETKPAPPSPLPSPPAPPILTIPIPVPPLTPIPMPPMPPMPPIDTGPGRQPAYTVSGVVRLADGSPAPAIIVEAVDRDLRIEQLLGRTQTDKTGAYLIGYSPDQIAKRERTGADLVVRALAADRTLLVASPVLFDAPPKATIDLVIPAQLRLPPTLFEKIAAALPPLIEGVKLEELEENEQFQDLTFLAGETGFAKGDLARFVLAQLLAPQGIQAEFWFALLGGPLFAYDPGQSLKAQLAALPARLSGQGADAVRKAVARGFDVADIPKALAVRGEDWIASFLKIAARLAVRAGASFTRSALDAAGVKDSAKQEKFAALLNQYQAMTPDLVAALQKDATFAPAEIAGLQTAFTLADLTAGDGSVVQSIMTSFAVRDPGQIATLAAKAPGEWVDFVKRQVAAGALTIPAGVVPPPGAPGAAPASGAEAYGAALDRKFREAFPTAAFMGGLDRALRGGGAVAKMLTQADSLRSFLTQHADFDLRTTPIDKYMGESVKPEFRTLAQDQGFRDQVKGLQRLFRFAPPSFDAVNTLLADGLHSARSVYRLGETAFVTRYGARPGFTADTALRAWNQAADTQVATLALIGQLTAWDPGSLPAVLQAGGPSITTFPNWSNLFHAGDLCTCEDCRSVLSPAAYFTDLLHFLKDRAAVNPAKSVKDILFQRRPDLGYLELSCDNALVPLPYIDLVCEVLEAAVVVVAGGNSDVPLPGLMTISASTKAAVAGALATAHLRPGSDFSLAQVNAADPNRWVVHGDETTYLLTKSGTAPFAARILRNTKASAAELRAYPAYVDAKAYDALRGARYPFILPFDLFGEEVRAAFGKCNLQRWDLMRTLRGPAAPNNPSDGDIAAEYLGIGVCPVTTATPIDEKTLIVRADPSSGQTDTLLAWGEPANQSWATTLTKLSNVKTFLNKSGLAYEELLALLDLIFISKVSLTQPLPEIVLQNPTGSCDTGQMTLAGVTAVNLDRIHRFIRLWRKLGWKMWEVDFVIAALGGGVLNEAFLIKLADLGRLRTRLGEKTSVEQLCALFGNLNTATYFTELHKKRGDALYQTLFRNRRLIQPLDPAFDVAAVAPIPPAPPPSELIAAHLPALLGGLRLSESDLAVFLGLVKTNQQPYFANQILSLDNISLLWRHSWLCKQLKLKSQEWPTLLKLMQQDVVQFADPHAALDFLDKVDALKACGLSLDELDWILSANMVAKSAPTELDASRFLTSLRKDLLAAFTPYRDTILAPPTSTADLTALLTSQLQQLGRDAAQTQFFLDTVSDSLAQEFLVPGLPVNFSFPVALTGGVQNIGIRYEPVLQFVGTMTAAQQIILKNDASLATVTPLDTYKRAIDALFQSPGQPAAVRLPAGFVFPPAIVAGTNNIPISYKPMLRLASGAVSGRLRFTAATMSPAQKTALLANADLGAVRDLIPYQDAIEALSAAPGQPVDIDLPAGFVFPPSIALANPPIPIVYEAQPTKNRLGAITLAQRDALKALVTGNTVYAAAMDEFYSRPVLAIKFFETVFTAPLQRLPAAVDFTTLADPALQAKIGYDTEQRLLRVTAILSDADKTALNALSPDVDYRAAVTSLYDQPRTIATGDERIWLEDSALQHPLRDPVNVNANLAAAVNKALTYLMWKTLRDMVVSECAAQLGLSEALTRYLLSAYQVFPFIFSHIPLLAPLSWLPITANGVVDHLATPVFESWLWAVRAARLLKKWNVALDDWRKLDSLPGLLTLKLNTLPLLAVNPIGSLDALLNSSRLLRFRDSVPETGIAFVDLLTKLATAPATYTSTLFAQDVHSLNDAWSVADVQALADGFRVFTSPFPSNDYLKPQAWERLAKAFSYLDSLNARAGSALQFAASTMGAAETAKLKELLRSKIGADAWLALSTDVQDVLRERKRDALAAYLLSRPMPLDAPSGKWENTDDLYAYYLFDVEMCSCQLTSRLVWSSGAIQLFVQRCFMGLERDVAVHADADSAWKWWAWMRKFQVWVANVKVFLFPEDWIRPELNPNSSPFFNDLKNELQQNDVNVDNVETAYANYLHKLDGVAQLEIAGFYQEDEGDKTILHVFGRSGSAEPHIYYYRTFDYRQWTPWQKVDLDIQGDYLTPAVVGKRLYLFWPVFTEVPDEQANKTIAIPDSGDSNAPVQRTAKRLRLQMAVSDFRQGKWTPRRISKDFAQSDIYYGDIVRKHYRFYATDRSQIDGRFAVAYQGYSLGKVNGVDALLAGLDGAFEFNGCDGGLGAADDFPFYLQDAMWPDQDYDENYPEFLKWNERPSRPLAASGKPEDYFALATLSGDGDVPLLMRTPGLFQMTTGWHLSYMDKLLLDGLDPFRFYYRRRMISPIGSWLPFFYNSAKRTFMALPCLRPLPLAYTTQPLKTQAIVMPPVGRRYYPEAKLELLAEDEAFVGTVKTGMDAAVKAVGVTKGLMGEAFLSEVYPDEPTPFSDEQIYRLSLRVAEQSQHYLMGNRAWAQFQRRQFHFKNFYHPFVCDFLRRIDDPLQGIDGLMKRETQLQDTGFSFGQVYKPTAAVVDPPTASVPNPPSYPREIVDFAPDGAYSSYNWELFFHAPLLIANALSQNQRFEEARNWYHYIFNPLGVESAAAGGSAMSKFWITKVFFETTDAQYIQQRIDNILGMVAAHDPALQNQVLDWRDHPFEPHRIANYRTSAYQKTSVMAYLDNLIAWGDFLFAQDSMESINEATQLYLLANGILGDPPRKIPPSAKPPLSSFNELESGLDSLSNAMVQVENLVPAMSGTGPGANAPPLPMLYFCIPQNDKLLGYWDTVADRLYKIRHCMNLQGVVRQLSLFEPPIDPGAMVKAVAGGADIGSALADLNAPLPLYRFSALLQKANELCADVKALGGALLGALEKKDSEALSLLRQTQEIAVLTAAKAVKEKQLEEAKQNLDGIKKSKLVTENRRDYYRDIERLSAKEKLHLDKTAESQEKQKIAQQIKIGASIISLLPAIDLGASGFGGSPILKFKLGGLELGQAASLASDIMSFLGQIAANDAAMASIVAGNDRRAADWDFQRDTADKELVQFDSQIASAELRITIAEEELANQVLQIENAKAVDDFMHSKYTNEDLYQWQVGQISGIYFQSYKLAYDLARRAERCFRFELGLKDSSYINFGYWDSLKKGLLAGERLQYDLRRLDAAYIEQNSRELELTKHVSLQLLDPMALVKLRETGRCFFQLPEWLFDLDYPGHYFRRIKSVSLTLPCVTGPYTTIACTLRLLKNAVRIDTSKGDNGYPRNVDDQGLPADDMRFAENNIAVKAIAASSAQNDSGVFELNFRDERYLPFEGAGAVSDWSLELFNDATDTADFGRALRQFDYETISDAIVHVKYTAREDAGPFKTDAIKNLHSIFGQQDATPSLRLFSMRQDFPSAWARFLNPSGGGSPAELDLSWAMSPDLFRRLDAGKTLAVNKVWILLRNSRPLPIPTYSVKLDIMLSQGTQSYTAGLVSSPAHGGLLFAGMDVSAVPIGPDGAPVTWKIAVKAGGATTDVQGVEDLFVVLGYNWAD